MRDRVFGIENEYGVMLKDKSGNFYPLRDNESPSIQSEDVPPGGVLIFAGNCWLPNGGRVYIDMGHPEYASPECRRVLDLVAASHAGERVCAKMFSYERADGNVIQLFKNNLGVSGHDNGHAVGIRGHSFGSHENYLVYGYRPKDQALQKHLIPFLITRQIMDGAGWWEKDGRFAISQRALVLGTVTGTSATDGFGRPVINLKDQSEIHGYNNLARLHLVLGDANIMDWALYLKFGTTSLVIAMLEDGYGFDSVMHDDPVRAAYEITFDQTGRMPCFTMFGGQSKPKSALEIQEMYLTRVKSYLKHTSFASPESRDEAWETVRMWEDTLRAIADGDIEWMLGRLDWATKLYLGNREVSKLNAPNAPKKRKIQKNVDILYHAVSDMRLRERMYRKWGARRLVSEEHIERMMEYPPHDTRARLRGLFARLSGQLADSRRLSALKSNWPSLNWPHVTWEGEEFSLGHPLDYRNKPLEELMDSIAKQYNIV